MTGDILNQTRILYVFENFYIFSGTDSQQVSVFIFNSSFIHRTRVTVNVLFWPTILYEAIGGEESSCLAFFSSPSLIRERWKKYFCTINWYFCTLILRRSRLELLLLYDVNEFFVSNFFSEFSNSPIFWQLNATFYVNLYLTLLVLTQHKVRRV